MQNDHDSFSGGCPHGPMTARQVQPAAWSGQAGCDVGPFCCEDTATRFATPPVDFGAYESLELRPAKCLGRWYVRVSNRSPGRNGDAAGARREVRQRA